MKQFQQPIRVSQTRDPAHFDFHVFKTIQAQLFAKREHEGVVQMLEVSVNYTNITL